MSKQLLILLCGLLLAAPLRAQSNDTTPIPHEITHRMPLFWGDRGCAEGTTYDVQQEVIRFFDQKLGNRD